jgi:hypothetical protein
MAMSVKGSDWVYLGVGLASTWYLTKMQNGDHPELDMLRGMLRVVWWLEKRLAKMESALLAEIDRELDSWQ